MSLAARPVYNGRMPRGRTNSQYPLAERKKRAFELFLQGRSKLDVAEEIGVSEDTAHRYHAQYEEQIREEAEANPRLLLNYLENTIRALQENELIRSRAWERYEGSTSDTIKAQMLNIALKAQSERAKLFGLLGVKQEFFAHVQRVQHLQTRLIEFMRTELCDADRIKLERLLEDHVTADGPSMPALQAG